MEAGALLPGLLRAPGGSTDHTVRRNTDKAIIGWTVDTRDWETQDARAAVDYIKGYGDLDSEIILMHSVYGSSWSRERARPVAPGAGIPVGDSDGADGLLLRRAARTRELLQLTGTSTRTGVRTSPYCLQRGNST